MRASEGWLRVRVKINENASAAAPAGAGTAASRGLPWLEVAAAHATSAARQYQAGRLARCGAEGTIVCHSSIN